MFSINYNVSEFVNSIKSYDNIFELLKITEDEVYQAERMVAPGRHGTPVSKKKVVMSIFVNSKGFYSFCTMALDQLVHIVLIHFVQYVRI